MCGWVSACSAGDGKMLYFNKRQRQHIKAQKLIDPTGRVIDDPDSHSMIAAYYGLSCDKSNKYEFRPLDREFLVDQINTRDDRYEIARKMRRLNYRNLAPPELVWKAIIRPFELPRQKPTKADMSCLRKWASVWASVAVSVAASAGDLVLDFVRASVRDSVRASAGDPVLDSVAASVWASAGDPVWDPFWASVRVSVAASVGDPVWVSVRASFRASVSAYIGSFFRLPRSAWRYTENIKVRGYPYQSCVTLWDRGLVPSFDGETWRLHSGKEAEIVYELPARAG